MFFFAVLVSVCSAADYRDGYLLVCFKETGTTLSSNTTRQAVVNAAGGGTIERMFSIVPGLGVVKLPDGVSVATAQSMFSLNAGVKYAEPDYKHAIQVIPNDPAFPFLWGLNNTGQTGGAFDADIDAPEAWNITTGSRSIVVAVTDSGIDYTHPDLVENMWVNTAEQSGIDGVDDDNNGYIDDIYGIDSVNMDSDPLDDHGHGTHCSGTIGGVGMNSIGVAGVSWHVQLMALKCFDAAGYGSTATEIEAIQYALSKGANVISASWGGYMFSQALYDVIKACRDQGILFVAAAGNESNDNDGAYPAYPSSYDLANIISVIATDNTDRKASFSNWGATNTDIAAPGVSIYSTAPGGGYQYMSGTSMAAPHVSGAAALVWSFDPTLTYADVRQILLSSVDTKTALKNLCATNGRMNVYNAVLLAMGSDSVPPTPNPMVWKVAPVAVGKTTIYMEAATAQDASGVEYFFDCLTDDTYDKVQDNPIYYRGDYAEGTSYHFQVLAQDKSEKQNQTEWSVTAETTTAAVVDNLTPYPNPAQWKAAPRKMTSSRIGMEAAQGYDEIDTIVEYRFDCTYTNDASFASADELDRDWSEDPLYTISGLSTVSPGHIYRFRVQIRDAAGNETEWSTEAEAILAPPAKALEVPTATYKTIQAAIDAANHGDTVIVHPGIYREININFKGKLITVRSENPVDPTIVASTIIDCQEVQNLYRHETRRAFLFQTGESRNTVLAGFTIRNATAFDEAEQPNSYTGYMGVWRQYQLMPVPYDGMDALGGAILIGNSMMPSSPTIRNCIFTNCWANGQYGQNGNSQGSQTDQDGYPGDRGGNGGNAYGGAIYAFSGSSPLIKECQFANCQAVGGNAGNGANGSGGGGHSNGVENANGHRGGDGGDAGLGGCAWGGAIYFEPNCLPELYDVRVSDCFVKVGEAGRGGNGGNGSDGKGTGRGGHGGNGGIGGDLRAPDSSAGAVYYGSGTQAIIDGCVFQRCRVEAILSGDYSGGNGGNGGNGAGDNQRGGNGGHGGPAYYIPDKMLEIGGVDAIGGTGGNGGNGSNGGARGIGGNGGFRHGTGGSGQPGGGSFTGHTGIFPSNVYYMAYYWEDTTNIDNPPVDPNDHLNFSYDWEWTWNLINETLITPPAGTTPGVYQMDLQGDYIFDSAFSPYFGLLNMIETYNIPVYEDPNFPGDPAYYLYDIDNATLMSTSAATTSLTPTNANQRSTGACAGANFYGENCVITMRDSEVSYNASFSNHGGGELYDKGCQAAFESCVFQGNLTEYEEVDTDYAIDGYGGAIFADQPIQFTFNNCEFTENAAYCGGAIYCNFAPSGTTAGTLELMDSTFSGNKADSHFMYSYGGAVYAGNSLHPYEEYYFNFLMNYRVSTYAAYMMLYLADPYFLSDFETFIVSFYDNDHGYANFYNPITTTLWNDEVETDHVLGGQPPVYSVTVTDCTFGTFEKNQNPNSAANLAPFGAAIYFDASVVTLSGSQFNDNAGQVGVGGYLYACDVMARDSVFNGNIASEITTRGQTSEQENAEVTNYGFGAGLYIVDSDIVLLNNRFVSNESTGFAGGLSIVGPSLSGGTQSVINNLFVENTAEFGGGALSAEEDGDVTVTNCSFVDNMVLDTQIGAGGALQCHGAFVDITNSIFWDNLSILGSQIAVGDPLETVQAYDPDAIPYSTVFANYSCIQGGKPNVYVAEGDRPWFWYGGRNIILNPMFLSVPASTSSLDRTFYLRQTAAGQRVDSPCVNAGTGSPNALAALLGFETTTRTDHVADAGVTDMGFHYDASLPVTSFSLQTSVIIADRFPHGTIMPNQPALYLQGTEVELTATPDAYYRVKEWNGTDNDRSYATTNYVTMDSDRSVQVEFELAVARNLYVPESYNTIEDAILASRSGDRVILAPRPDEPYLIEDPEGINFGGKQLVIQSADPNDPWTVASTIIDCQGSRYISKRAFYFGSGEDQNSKIEGITIRNAFKAVIGMSAVLDTGRWPWPFDTPPDPLPPFRALSGLDGTGDSYGGAILCENGSSPTIRNCIFENCTVSGGIGGDGADGMYPPNMITDADLDSQSGGHSGKGTGDGYGGAIAVKSRSAPRILHCTFRNNRATGGWGGIPGDAGLSYNSGRYGWGGNDSSGIAWAMQYGVNPEAGYGEGDGHGGAIFVAAGCDPKIVECTFEGNYARPGYVSPGGAEAGGNDYPEPWDGDPWGQAGMREGRDGQLITYDITAGGAISLEENANVTLEGCVFTENQAYNVYVITGSEFEMVPVAARGGAIYSDPNVILNILPITEENDPNAIIKGSEFTGNMAGAIYSSYGDKTELAVKNAHFINNSSTLPASNDAASSLLASLTDVAYELALPSGDFDIAGGITVGMDASFVSIRDCQFMGNTSHVDGGAIRTASDIDFEDCVLNGNTAQGDGGAVYGYAPVAVPGTHTIQLTFDNCELSGNDAQGFGGAAFVKNCLLSLNNSFLVSNKAFSGGALRVSYSTFDMTGCLVFGNSATGVITGSHRSVTEEGFGGGLHITDTPFTIEHTRFENNMADGIIASGGAICITGSQVYYEQVLKNCLFADNQSDLLGGAVSCLLTVDADFENCTFANNTAKSQGGALYIDHLSRANLTRSIFSGNKGIGIYEKSGGQSTVTYSLFSSNEGGDMYDGGTRTVYSGNAAPNYSNILSASPQFAKGQLGEFYLNQASSPAVNPFASDSGYPTAMAAGLDTFTTDPAESLDASASKVDLGYHYIHSSSLKPCHLTVSFIDDGGAQRMDVGTIEIGEPFNESGAAVSVVTRCGTKLDISSYVKGEYFLTGWSGGTFNDNSYAFTNTVLMTRDKEVHILVRMRHTLYVGGSSEFDTLGDAIYAAGDGDFILVAPGEYTSPSQFPTIANTVILTSKKVTISGFNPSDEAVVRNTIFRDYRFELAGLDDQTVIEGVTFNQCWTRLENADIIIRNCVYSECQFSDSTWEHNNPPAGTDGYHQDPIYGGAIAMFDSSPKIINCTFENNRIRGADGENGFGGAQSHPTGGDGGWPGAAYGGAVYCTLSSHPEFVSCTFNGNEAFGGNGGNGADGWVNNGVVWNGGRGGGWLYDPEVEELLKVYGNGGWDGWITNSYGHKYDTYLIYSLYYGQYDIDLWSKWFGWGDQFASWDEFAAFDPTSDPYDTLLEPWRYGGFGGAVYCEFDSGASFVDCVFENNQSHGGLTGIGGRLPGDSSRWPDRQLNMPTAGGAVYAAWDSDLTFTRCMFRGNTADKTTVELPNTFSVSFGGAVAYENDCEVTFTECDIQDNDATVGGGIYGRYAVSNIADCNVFGNEAYMGAGIYLELDRAVITSTVFNANVAKVPDTGVPATSLELEGMGAGLFAHLLDLSIHDSVFVENIAQISGGGLLLSGTVEKPTDIFNCLFARNRARSDGGGASVNWMSRANFRNCTFGHNRAVPVQGEFIGSGGGLYIATESIVNVIDSIFWGNEANEGVQVTVGSGFEFDPRPSELTISYSTVGGYPSANAIYKGAGCTLNTGPRIISQSPEFKTLPDADPKDVIWQYYLDQQLSASKDKGSRTSVEAGLDGYTTSINGAHDKGVVDLGYHYLVSARTQCGDIDEAMILSGQIDIDDLVEFLITWLDECSEPGWCGGSDLNYDGYVDLDDMWALSYCWLAEDTEIPYPSPVQWVVEPNATTGTLDTIDMVAGVVHDAWWPDSHIEYYFDCVSPDNDAYDSGWRSNPSWSISGLPPQEYAYMVIARDGSGNETVRDELMIRRVTPGDFTLPQPRWKTVPYVTTNNTVKMELRTYEEITGQTLPSGYNVAYSFDSSSGNSRAYILNPVWTDPAAGYIAGQTYTYVGKMQLYYGNPSSDGIKIGTETTITAQLVFVPGDLYAPLPNPAQHSGTSPYQTSIGIQWYHVVTAVPAIDIDALGEEGDENVNVEYKFVCSQSQYSSGGSQDEDGIEWRNIDNVAGLYYPNGTLQTPQQYWARVGLKNQLYSWYIIVRDRSVARNTTANSQVKQVQAVP
jgi:predicted outer membrane repeat protein